MADILHKNRTFVLAILGVPVLGMLIAAGMIVYLRPDNMIVALGVILFVAMQYILFMYFWMKRVETLAGKQVEETEPTKKYSNQIEPLRPVNLDEMLASEEKRVLPIEEE